jgi:hypothetical protein
MRPALPGGVPERPKGTGCKPVGSAYGGSNPPAPTSPPSSDGNTVRADLPRMRIRFVALSGLIVLSAVARSVIAWRHSVPRLFPDEYIYAALGRSLAHGHLEIRGAAVHFPGILEPLIAAPLWRFFGLTTAYHLVQVENAVAASLAAIPLYLLARSLRLSSSYSLAVAAYGLLIPELLIVAYTTSDAVAYPLALGAVAAAVAAIDRPSSANQVLFLCLAALAALARVQYAVLVPAYFVGAFVIDGRSAFRRNLLPLLILVPGGIAAVLAAHTYYGVHLGTWLSGGFVSWFFEQQFLLAVEFGVVAAPGAVVGLISARGRRERAFATFTGAFAVALLAVAARIAAETGEFKERYLLVLLALAPIAFGMYLRNRVKPVVVIGIAAAIAVAAARLPLADYARGTLKLDSEFLFAVSELQGRHSTFATSLMVAVAATAAAGLAVTFAFRRGALVGFGIAAAVALVTTTAAARSDLRTTPGVRAALPSDLRWVDHAARGPVVAVETEGAPRLELLYQLYWNTSIERELLLGKAIPTDVFSAPRIHIRRDGSLDHVHADVLFDDYATTGWFGNARRIASAEHFTLWRPVGTPRLRLLVEGRYSDGWLNPVGRLRAWPGRNPSGVRVSFRLSLPSSDRRTVPVLIGGQRVTLHAGSSIQITCSSRRAPLDIVFGALGPRLLPDQRIVTERMTEIVVQDGGQRSSPTCKR